MCVSLIGAKTNDTPDTACCSCIGDDVAITLSAPTIHPNFTHAPGCEIPPISREEAGTLGATALDTLPEEKGESVSAVYKYGAEAALPTVLILENCTETTVKDVEGPAHRALLSGAIGTCSETKMDTKLTAEMTCKHMDTLAVAGPGTLKLE